VDQVEFSAYAFNEDLVKSATSAPFVYKLTPPPTQEKPRAYIVTVGVNANQTGWDLDFAAKSALDMQQLLKDKLKEEYKVVDVQLLSDFEPDGPRVSLKQATKENIRAVLDVLAGRPVDEERRREVPKLDTIQPATPDDLVILFITSHGYADPRGHFYVIPYNTGILSGISEQILNLCLSHPEIRSQRCSDARTFISNSISSDDFEDWWRGVDAGKMVMVLDSCHSAAVPGREFRPGPLGDRGFGQLSYDKGMVILTAAQPDKAAWATVRKSINRTLLSDALISGLTVNPGLSLTEWLREAEKRVPQKYKEVFPEISEEDVQVPVLLNFSRKGTSSPKAMTIN
jgi:hypothetical protein